jgi:hypothetical protein
MMETCLIYDFSLLGRTCPFLFIIFFWQRKLIRSGLKRHGDATWFSTEIKPIHTQIMAFISSHSSCNARLIWYLCRFGKGYILHKYFKKSTLQLPSSPATLVLPPADRMAYYQRKIAMDRSQHSQLPTRNNRTAKIAKAAAWREGKTKIGN